MHKHQKSESMHQNRLFADGDVTFRQQFFTEIRPGRLPPEHFKGLRLVFCIIVLEPAILPTYAFMFFSDSISPDHTKHTSLVIWRRVVCRVQGRWEAGFGGSPLWW